MNGKLSGLCDESISFDADYVSDVKKLLENGVVHSLVFTRAYLITFYIHLNPSCLVLQLNESGRSHNPA